MTRHGSSWRTAAVVLLLAFALAPQRAHAQAQRDSSFPVSRTAVVDITMRTGRLVVRGSDRPSGTVRSTAQEFTLRSTGVGIVLSPSETMPSSDPSRREWSRRTTTARGTPTVELELPRGVRLVINTTSATVDVASITGDVEIRTVSGDVVLQSLAGRLILESISGDILLRDGSGAVRATTVSGNITLGGDIREAALRTTSGDLRVDGADFVQLRAETVSGDVRIAGGLADNAQLDIRTHSGDVQAQLPESARGTVVLSTFSGTLNARRPLTLLPDESGVERGARSTRRYSVGGGGAAMLRITTFNGDVTLYPDGP